ncbi:hypothetical protein [Sideroxydans lithotrophicus]|uniref:Uncharacterized protein n=1 Tax=Sideroxydans lithotrophicus (strain ES-1) TaxID=580332 RepID=D5CS03_SIDLE|nr:hypothetical protein [Sideroxydans lithotrophicus]ADE11739.1 conserved hypothetical protein [Sideroxydans lithotrophicus ES-1]
MSEQEDNGLAEFFVAGVEPADVPQFFPLFAAKPLIGAMIALFRGGDDEVMVRLMVLREIGLRAEAPEWSPRELQSHFAFINQSKLNTVLGRLREHELLLWDNERHLYRLSSAGRMVLSALSSLLNFNTEQDGEFLAAQIAAGAAVGKLSPEALAHLLARLAELEEEFSQAVTSGSEFRLREAQTRLEAVQKWMDKANEVMRDLATEGLDDTTWKLSQQIGQRQSKLMRMSSVFQRELAEISRQQVHLSHGGLSSSELAAWLKQRTVDELVELAAGQLTLTPETTFILPDVMVDNTEEFVARDLPNRRVSAMPAPSEVEYVDDIALDPPYQLAALVRLLSGLDEPLTLADGIVGGGFSDASYRLSLLSFLGEQNVDPELAPLAHLPLRLCWDENFELQHIGRDEIAAMSGGHIEPQQEKNT